MGFVEHEAEEVMMAAGGGLFQLGFPLEDFQMARPAIHEEEDEARGEVIEQFGMRGIWCHA